VFRHLILTRIAVGSGALAIAASTIALAAPTRSGPVQRPGTSRSQSVRTNAVTHTFYGGGATLPAIAYVGVSQATTTNPATAPDPNSVFGFFEAHHTSDGFSYCQTGSGYGRKVIDGAALANGACAALGATPTGFGSPNQFGDFAGSDAPLAQSDYSTFTTNAATTGSSVFGRGEFVQVPYIAGAVAVMYNNPDVSGQLLLSPTALCKIADGQITNWNQLPESASNPSGPHFPSRTLNFVYRTDSSGTTFSFSNYVSAITVGGKPRVCTGAGQTYGLNSVYDPGNTTVSPAPTFGVLPTTLPAGASNAHFLGGNGNPGVVECIQGTAQCYSAGVQNANGGAGSIGYVEAANALASVGGSINFADLYISSTMTVDPIKDLPQSAGLVKIVKLDQVVGASVANGRPGPLGGPDIVALSPAPIKANCVGIVDPQSYEDPGSGYPIIAVTNLEFSSAGNADATDLSVLGKQANIFTNFAAGKITSVDPFGTPRAPVVGKTGYSTIQLPTSGTTSPHIISNCVGS
jgi:phosphate transport system substrate-binding protein